MEQPRRKPEILAPAGETTAFLAALAAKADAIYIGLKKLFSQDGGAKLQSARGFAPL